MSENSFQNFHFFLSYFFISLLLLLITIIYKIFSSRPKLVYYLSCLFVFSLCIIINRYYTFQDHEIIIKNITYAVITICFLTCILMYSINRIITNQWKAVITLSTNIKYDYDFFFNKSNALTEIKNLINEKQINLMLINVFNFKFETSDSFNDYEIDEVLKEILTKIQNKIKYKDIFSFITYENNFAICYYGNNEVSYTLKEINELQLEFLNILNSFNITYYLQNKKLIIKTNYTFQLYGLTNHVIETIIKTCDNTLFLQDKQNNVDIDNKFHFFKESKTYINGIIKEFLDEHSLNIELRRTTNNDNYYYVSLKTIAPLMINDYDVKNLIDQEVNNEIIYRYIAFKAIQKFSLVKKENEKLIINYPINVFIENSRSLLFLFETLDDLHIDINQIIFSIDISKKNFFSIDEINNAIKILKNFNINLAINFPNNLKSYNYLYKNDDFLNNFDYLIINVPASLAQ